MVSLIWQMPAKNLIYFEDLALSLEKDKKSFFHGVHKTGMPVWASLFLR